METIKCQVKPCKGVEWVEMVSTPSTPLCNIDMHRNVVNVAHIKMSGIQKNCIKHHAGQNHKCI